MLIPNGFVLEQVMFSCCKHVCVPESFILDVWDILKAFVLAHIKVLFDISSGI